MRGRHSKKGFPSGSAVKNPPAVQETKETRVQSLGYKDPLEEGMATHYSILARESHGQGSLGVHSPWGCKESDTIEATSTHSKKG